MSEAKAAEEAEVVEGEEITEEGQEGEAKSGGKTKLIIIIAGAVVLLLVIGGAAAYFLGLFGGDHKEDHKKVEAAKEVTAATEIEYFEFPQILVNLNEPGRKGKFLKLSITFELAGPEVKPIIEKIQPRILDQFQMYLRELRYEDLQGSEGVHRLREELLRRVNNEIGADKVKDVLFKDILVQ